MPLAKGKAVTLYFFSLFPTRADSWRCPGLVCAAVPARPRGCSLPRYLERAPGTRHEVGLGAWLLWSHPEGTETQISPVWANSVPGCAREDALGDLSWLQRLLCAGCRRWWWRSCISPHAGTLSNQQGTVAEVEVSWSLSSLLLGFVWCVRRGREPENALRGDPGT